MEIGRLVSYWRDSLIDADLAAIDLSQDNHVRLPLGILTEGTLPIGIVKQIYTMADVPLEGRCEEPSWDLQEHLDDEEDDEVVQGLPILIAPIVAADSRRAGRLICPLWVPAQLCPSGELRVDASTTLPWIVRQFLEPTNLDLVIGNVADLDQFRIGHTSIVNNSEGLGWRAQFDYGWRMMESVAGADWRDVFTGNHCVLSDRAAIVPQDLVRGVSHHIERVYTAMLQSAAYPPLLQTYGSLNPEAPERTLSRRQWHDPAAWHVGTLQKGYPISPSQREALHHFLIAPSNTIVAVDGPPGTGKTTLLHSVIASLWVDAALRNADPPLIVVSSTNNQAVTNVLDSLNRLDSLERWLPEPVDGLGVYLTNNRAKRKEAETRGIPVINRYDEGLPEELQNAEFVEQARGLYLRRCSDFYDRPIDSVEEAVYTLRASLQNFHGFMCRGLDMAYSLLDMHTELGPVLGALGPSAVWAVRLEEELTKAREDLERWRLRFDLWRQIPGKSRLLVFLSRLGLGRKLAEKRSQARAAFLNEHLPELRSDLTDPEIVAHLTEQLDFAEKKVQTVLSYTTKQAELAAAEKEWREWCDRLGRVVDSTQLDALENPDGTPNGKCLHNVLDQTLRFWMIEYAVNYWEGRWLMEMEDNLRWTAAHRDNQNREAQEAKWRRYAMLTPCFVTTMHTGPGFFDYYDGASHPLFETIDLLIVDEAGQVTPEVSGAMFALAKQALVVGDILQIEPVWSVIEAVDRGNLERAGLLNGEVDWAALHEKGLTASTGSVMRMAQSVSLYQLPSSNGAYHERGMFLAEHRRSVPEVIDYSNKLAYRNRLRPLRPSIKDYPWPHMGYAHVKGHPMLESGSRKNLPEAQALVQWLADSRYKLESYYEKDIAKIAGIVTPFVAQNKAIRRALAAVQLEDVKTGTVHTFQGGERDVMLFSPVYSSRDDVSTYFFDRGVNMLNVAVSRARDSFLVFGDMDIFDPSKLQRPSALLARFLFADEHNELNPYPIPVRGNGSIAGQDIHLLNTLKQHIGALARAFERAEDRLVIVSPYVRWQAVATDEVVAKTRAAVRRGVNVVIYLDDMLNKNLEDPSAAQAVAALHDAGATIKVCHNIHSKMICIDDDVFIEGSFNWLSAARDGEYQRLETSMIYTGPKAPEFIRTMVEDLERVGRYTYR